MPPPRSGSPRLVAIRGEVLVKRAPGDNFEPATVPLGLGRRDEVETRDGAAQILLSSGMFIDLSERTLTALIGGSSDIDAYLAHGTLTSHPAKGGEVHSVQIACSAGRVTLRGKSTRIRLDGDSAAVMVYDGGANVWGRGAVTITGGQMTLLRKGAAPTPPRALAAAPAWKPGPAEAITLPTDGELHWQALPSAARYRLELTFEDEPLPLGIETDVPRAELRGLRPGSYIAQLFAIEASGALGEGSEPRRLVLAEVPTAAQTAQAALPGPGGAAHDRGRGRARPRLAPAPRPAAPPAHDDGPDISRPPFLIHGPGQSK